jgi:hypothetical protein
MPPIIYNLNTIAILHACSQPYDNLTLCLCSEYSKHALLKEESFLSSTTHAHLQKNLISLSTINQQALCNTLRNLNQKPIATQYNEIN